MRVTYQTWVAPLFDVATATAHFHRIARHLARIAAGAELDHRREDACECVGVFLARVGAHESLCGLKHHGARLLCGNAQLVELALHQRHVFQALAERNALVCHVLGLGDSAAHHAGGAHAVGQARVVHHVGHLHKAASALAHQIGDRAVQTDFTAGHRACAELVLEANDAIAIGAAVVQRARQQEQRDAFHACGVAIHMREHHRKFCVGVGAEPLVARDAPRAIRVGAGHGLRVGDVGARGLLGHEHGALCLLVKIERQELRQVFFNQLRRAEFFQRARE